MIVVDLCWCNDVSVMSGLAWEGVFANLLLNMTADIDSQCIEVCIYLWCLFFSASIAVCCLVVFL